MNIFYACAFVLVFFSACASQDYQSVKSRPVQLLDPPGYPPELRARDTAARVLNW